MLHTTLHSTSDLKDQPGNGGHCWQSVAAAAGSCYSRTGWSQYLQSKQQASYLKVLKKDWSSRMAWTDLRAAAGKGNWVNGILQSLSLWNSLKWTWKVVEKIGNSGRVTVSELAKPHLVGRLELKYFYFTQFFSMFIEQLINLQKVKNWELEIQV